MDWRLNMGRRINLSGSGKLSGSRYTKEDGKSVRAQKSLPVRDSKSGRMAANPQKGQTVKNGSKAGRTIGGMKKRAGGGGGS